VSGSTSIFWDGRGRMPHQGSGITEHSDSAAIVAGRGRGFGTAVTGKAAGAGHPGPALSAVTCLASTTGAGGCVTGWPQHPGMGRTWSKESVMSVYRVTEIIGTSSTSWEDAAAEAIRTAAGTLRDLRVAEVVKQDIHLDEGGAITYRTKLQLSFKYEPER
jgi:flavin-binding protein dodecin